MVRTPGFHNPGWDSVLGQGTDPASLGVGWGGGELRGTSVVGKFRGIQSTSAVSNWMLAHTLILTAVIRRRRLSTPFYRLGN